ncbi:PQQ-like beta-propeller repeat protein, partial [Candidatus Bathyarchaeota archaeon]|nr:PQQ-like beta-propeller repeat protein [Candidatus Bathyarchaeota archaeon]
NKVYVGSLDTKLYCLDSNSGNVVWTFETGGYITSSPAAENQAVYITSKESSSGALYKIDSNDGSLIWKMEIPYVIAADRGTDLHSSPTIGDGLIFVAANKQNYYAVNATTGEIKWNFVTTEGTEGIGGYLVASTSYQNGELYIVDMFFITALNSSSGDVLWKSWIGTELYTTPTYAEEKIYVTTDRRFVYTLNASDGTRFAFFDTGSNSWSAPSVHEGRVYFGSNDGNVYCLDDTIVTKGQIVSEFEMNEIEYGEIITGCGQLTPEIAHAKIFLTFIKPDSTIDNKQVTTQNDGTFCFYYEPDIFGEWTVSIRCSGSSYIMKSEELKFNVIETQQPNENPDEPEQPNPSHDSGITIELVTLIVGIIIIIISVVLYFLIKKRNSTSTIMIND